MNSSESLLQSLKKGFIDRKVAGSKLDPQLIVNQSGGQDDLLNIMQAEVESCQSFFFSVAFITQSGLDAIKTQLADLAKRGVSGKLLTSTYLNFNEPEVFASLAKIPNLEVRISQKNGFHSKGYLFQQPDYYTFIIGSSNLTMSALKLNYEWNVRLSSIEHGEVVHQAQTFFAQEWALATPLDANWLADYQANYQARPVIQVAETTPEYITPNKMQQVALKNLQELRQSGATKGLVISATGTGKTYLAAFDVRQAAPKRFLYIVHREQILKKAAASFQKIIGGPASDYGILSGNTKETQAKYLFATVQSLAKQQQLNQFQPTDFDYILIDEVHKAGAATYQRIFKYFQPHFFLGMTATPERTDDFNIFELFDYNIAYEIRLQDALAEDFLCPFHYFGVTDYVKDGEKFENTSKLTDLVAEERVAYLIEKLDYYGCYHNQAKGLVFCSRKEEAQQLAQLFSAQSLPSVYLSGEDSINQREMQISRLENGEINYIFTVDIFNEGVDIPQINQVVMLRNTESSIVFIQQLGRGLRKDPTKKFVTVIDFIGNYQNNYMIPMALSGDVSRNKNKLRQSTFDTSYISGLSAVNFEAVAKEKVFKSIDQVKLDSLAELRTAFNQLKIRLNRVPYLHDFQTNNVLDPLILANKFTSYYNFLVKLRQNEGTITATENECLKFFSRELLAGIRQQELVLLETLMTRQSLARAEFKAILDHEQLPATDDLIDSVLNTLTIAFYAGGQAKTYANSALIQVNDQQISLAPTLKAGLTQPYFCKLWLDALQVAKFNSKAYDPQTEFTLYKKYKRRDALRLANWHQQLVDQNIGGYTYNKTNHKFVIFMTIEKGADFKGAQIAYEDTILDPESVLYFTKSPRTIRSPEVGIFQVPQDWQVYLFAKKSDDEGKDFYFLGQVDPISDTIKQVSRNNSSGNAQSLVQLNFALRQALPNTLFRYLTTGAET
ncbi:MAG: DEAD/DEAH box helicase, partial [Loigolactobacillus coryniformis]|uniref:DUF3427 domain-containing protein n=1 Tax=Loigolactobacillus coryniformis TaxID=1610 RepID=UPI0026481C83